MRMKSGRLRDHIRNVLSFLVWGIFLTIGLYFGWTLTKQAGDKDLDDMVRQFKSGEKARMERLTEITDYMSNVAVAIAAYHEEANSFPHSLHTTDDIKASLGVGISTNKISSINVATLGPDEVTIEVTVIGIDSGINGKTLKLTGSPSKQYGLLWTWGGTVPSVYWPKGKIKGKTPF